MTPTQRKQINDIKTRIKNAREGGGRDEFIRAGLIQEGWVAAAIQQAFEELEQ